MLEGKLNQMLKDSMVQKDRRTSDVIRMIKTKVMERRTAKGFKGQVDDDLYLSVISSYVKQLGKALEEYKAAGDRGKEFVEQLGWEIDFCNQFLPKELDVSAPLEVLVKEAITRLGVTSVNDSQKIVKDLMKASKGKFTPNEIKALVEKELNG